MAFQEGLVSTDLIGAVIPRPPNCEEQQASISISCSPLLSFSTSSETNVEAMGRFPAAIPSLNTILLWAAVSAQKYLLLPLATTRPLLQLMVNQWSHLRDCIICFSPSTVHRAALYSHGRAHSSRGCTP